MSLFIYLIIYLFTTERHEPQNCQYLHRWDMNYSLDIRETLATRTLYTSTVSMMVSNVV